MDENAAFAIRTEDDKYYDEKGPSGAKKKTYVMLLDKFRNKLLKDLKPAELKVLLCLALHCDAEMICWPSLNLIAKETGYSKPTVLKALDELYKRGMVEKTTREKEDGSPDSNLYRIKSPSMLSRGSKKNLPPPGSKPELPRGSKADTTNVVKPTLPEVEPNLEVKPIEVENKDGSSKKQEQVDEQAIIDEIAADFLNNTAPEDLQRVTAAARAEAGNWADPAQAGGDDAVAFAALEALYDGEPPNPESGIYTLAMEKLGLVLAQRGVRDVAVGRKAGELMREANRKSPAFLNPALKTFESAFDVFVAEAQKQGGKAPTRAARYDTPAIRASQKALAKRKASRGPPTKDDKWGQAVKGELQLQMTKATFDAWVKPAGMVCDDGVFVVTVANAFAKDWLEDRLATTIERTAVGVLGRAVEVRFEEQPEEVEG